MHVQYSLRDGEANLIVFVERDLATLLLAHIKPKGIGFLKTEAQVERAIRDGVREAFETLRQGQ